MSREHSNGSLVPARASWAASAIHQVPDITDCLATSLTRINSGHAWAYVHCGCSPLLRCLNPSCSFLVINVDRCVVAVVMQRAGFGGEGILF